MSELKRLVALAEADAEISELRWHWLSFADDNGWLGCAVVQARGFPMAVIESHRLKINPGGEVQGLEIPFTVDPPEALCNRIIKDKAELDRLSEEWIELDRGSTS